MKRNLLAIAAIVSFFTFAGVAQAQFVLPDYGQPSSWNCTSDDITTRLPIARAMIHPMMQLHNCQLNVHGFELDTQPLQQTFEEFQVSNECRVRLFKSPGTDEVVDRGILLCGEKRWDTSISYTKGGVNMSDSNRIRMLIARLVVLRDSP